ncbi:MAG TPA: hypothetical protein VIT44_05690 [Cyclobacteriaceae bacterium]
MKKINALFLAFMYIFLLSCKEEGDKISEQQSAAVTDQSVAEAYFNDASDISTAAYNSPDQSSLGGRTGGRTIEIVVSGDTRFNGATVTLVTTGTLAAPAGNIVIDFGTGKTDPAGTTRKGKILVAYSGFRFLPASYTTITFDGYEVNGVKIAGSRKITTTSFTNSNILFAVVDTDGKATFSDGTFVTRQSNHTRRWIFPTTSNKGEVEVEGTVSGTTRDSKSYNLLVTRKLIFKVECSLAKIYAPAEGEATLTVDNLPIQINYGAVGTACDNKATITFAGTTQEITVN